ncbi:hypothetical protein M9435_006983 [Picochlorum sp. BPE23]|nr:hypothetical protein M9435_006983 [Picochlorum sp. BPE23]
MSSIRKSPYEEGLYFVDPEPGSTMQSIGSMEWKVGSGYELIRVLGYGSYSCVCLAKSRVDGGLVALKRIGNVLNSHEQTKRVLREIAILRRINHPNVIQLKDVFLQPSSTGECRLVGGKLVHCSVDLYIATEFADGGDLYHMKGQLTGDEVTAILWQLLGGLKYLHSLRVWHRDVKSQNVFVVWQGGQRVVKLGDFGSARSHFSGSEQGGVKRSDSNMNESAQFLHPISSTKSMAMDSDVGDLLMEPSADGSGFKAPLTRVVATPCYRAPEVVISRGGYTDAIDMWGLGCIFGEMLSRVAYVGSATTPHLQVAPMFALKEMPKTPNSGETYGRPECATTRRELEALFDVIGTPAWRDVDVVEMEAWRNYLAKLPGKAPKLQRKFKAAGEVAIHLLTRLLEFDPQRRPSCDEAMLHEYFEELRDEMEDLPMTEDVMLQNRLDSLLLQHEEGTHDHEGKAVSESTSPTRVASEEDPARALAMLEMHLENILVDDDRNLSENEDCFSETTQKLLALLEAECKAVQQGQIAFQKSIDGRSKKPTRRVNGGLLEDQGASIKDNSDYARERLSNVADTRRGGELDPTKFLGAHRHGEWSAQSGSGHKIPPGPRWGVSTSPPGGGDPMDPRIRKILTKQQGR